MNNRKVKLIECPRDAMQGLKRFIPTEEKTAYLQTLLQVGFDTIDFGSFVSAKAIPQMSDTHELIRRLTPNAIKSNLLAIIANTRGAAEAVQYPAISHLGFPFSVSETFQLRNTNRTIEQSIGVVKEIGDLCAKNNKEFVIYLSMAFGNPYGDAWNADVLGKYIDLLKAYHCRIFALSDTVGIASPDSIYYLFESIIPAFPDIEIGAHLHTTPVAWQEKIKAALLAGCRRFDGAIKGYGGCPMAKDELTGNMPTEKMVEFLQEEGYHTGIDIEALAESVHLADHIFSQHE
ncbi:MAG TPA: hydroxymethylglutaryl-CoA lyase [Saprospiraceae bacterium]|nr:hydroxymethylglutaryl-CoA lyase [Saprospiraceae bacterium]HMX87900.1 hydroxymethylglutaryl-CoA lyase [Saprospiraceae bacterium]HMZ39748.1 hydroxymethylglutaryl-CoA lyase [Saprospiraceae bacterium]HNA63380.1 hydroxymethylglutaryl-CoA lyase [Saprospiraceae bacterium]HNB31052.1 hydroxymethylglutaryl-CoA lyase [Saprospiraceae bacterium]